MKAKVNRIENGSRKGLKLILALATLVVGGAAVILCYGQLCRECAKRSVITDFGEQVKIESGKMVRAEVIAEYFGLKAGANLAQIDFRTKRRELLAKVPTLRAVTIRRIMPDKVVITAEERTPIARLNLRGNRRVTGRVVDSDGVVFICQRGTQMLPTIRETSSPGTQPGQLLNGRSAEALELIVTCRDAEYQELGLLEVDASKPDYLTMTLSNYSKVKIVWSDHADLVTRLNQLMAAIHSQIGTNVKIWNATMPDKIFADTQEKL